MNRVVTTGLVALAVGAATVSCSSYGSSYGNASSSASSSSASSASASPSGSLSNAALCASVDDLQKSIAGLKDVPVVQQGTAALDQALQDVRTNVQQVAANARGEHQDQVAAVQADLTALGTTLDAAKTDSTAATLGAVATGMGKLATDAGTLITDVKSTC